METDPQIKDLLKLQLLATMNKSVVPAAVPAAVPVSAPAVSVLSAMAPVQLFPPPPPAVINSDNAQKEPEADTQKEPEDENAQKEPEDEETEEVGRGLRKKKAKKLD